MIGRTVRAALGMDSGEIPFHVVVIDDASDDDTFNILAEFDDDRLHLLCREKPHAQQGKGEALNAGYRYVRSMVRVSGRAHEDFDQVVVGVFDADGQAEPGALPAVTEAFREPGVAAVQTRVRIRNHDHPLGMLQDLEFSCVADASQQWRDRLGSVGLGGNGQFTRLSVLERLGPSPWSSCLVEDLELGLRLHLLGFTIRYCPQMTINQQALTSPRRLVRQRTRWAQGNLQCVRYLRGLMASRTVGGPGLLDFVQYLVTPWLVAPASIAVTLLISVTVSGLVSGVAVPGLVAAGSDAAGALLVWLVAGLLPGMLWTIVYRCRYRQATWGHCLVVGALYPGFLVLGVISSWWAMGRHLNRRNAWAKTERLHETDGQEVALSR